MALSQLANGDTGLQARTKINAGLTAIDVSAATTFNRAKAAGFASKAARRFQRAAVTPILDKISATAMGVYSFAKLRAAYSGNCCRVRRSSDNALLAIPFLSDGVVDVGLMLAFRGVSDLYLETFYDQSGSGLDAVQATAANQPYIDMECLVGGMPTARMVGFATMLVLPSGAAITSTANAAVWMALYNTSSRSVERLFEFGTTGQFSVDLTPYSAFSVQPVVNNSYLNFGNPNMATIPNANGVVFGLNSGAGGLSIYRNNASFSRAAATAITPAAGGTIGSSSGCGYDLQAFVAFNSALSAADSQLLQYGMGQIFKAVTAPKASVVLTGDSITASAALGGYNYTKELLNFLPDSVAVQVVAQGGHTAQGMAGEVTSYVTGLFKAGMTNLAILGGGVNDVTNGRTAAQIQGDWTTWAAAVKAAGFIAGLEVLFPRNVAGGYTAAMEAVRVAVNTWARANCGPGLTFDFIVDFEQEPGIMPTISSADFPDNLHPSLAGYKKITPVLADAIIRQLPSV